MTEAKVFKNLSSKIEFDSFSVQLEPLEAFKDYHLLIKKLTTNETVSRDKIVLNERGELSFSLPWGCSFCFVHPDREA